MREKSDSEFPLRSVALAVVVILLVSVASVIGLGLLRNKAQTLTTRSSETGPSVTLSSSGSSCSAIGNITSPLKSLLSPVTFGAVTKFALPSPGREPNAIAVAPDGSVWFGELALPGVGHLFPNGTLIEYQWPFDRPSPGGDCSLVTNIWGVALWDGRVWASDTASNQLVGLSPANDSFKVVKVPTNESFPYTLTVAPDGRSLWFTELFSSKVAQLSLNGSVTEYTVEDGRATPTQVVFANESTGYLVNVGGRLNNLPPAVFSFNPNDFSSSQARVGGNRTLYSPDSIALGGKSVWLAQHGASSVISYNLTNGRWTTYPTSTVDYIDTTLPYFVATNGTQLWFNEHYANRLAVLNIPTKTLTEYSLANPPITNASEIQNSLTFALGGGRAWFTQWTANYVGFVNASARPSFSARIANTSPVELPPMGRVSLNLLAEGTSTRPLSVQFSDSERFTSIPQNLSLSSSPSAVASLSGESNVTVTVEAKQGLQPGNYTLLLTLNGGLVLQSAYVELRVG